MSDVVNISSSAVIIGSFDSRRRYVRKDLVMASDAFSVPHGQTLQTSVNTSGAVSRAMWRYSVNGYVVQGDGTSGLSFNATITRARL